MIAILLFWLLMACILIFILHVCITEEIAKCVLTRFTENEIQEILYEPYYEKSLIKTSLKYHFALQDLKKNIKRMWRNGTA